MVYSPSFEVSTVPALLTAPVNRRLGYRQQLPRVGESHTKFESQLRFTFKVIAGEVVSTTVTFLSARWLGSQLNRKQSRKGIGTKTLGIYSACSQNIDIRIKGVGSLCSSVGIISSLVRNINLAFENENWGGSIRDCDGTNYFNNLVTI